MQQWWEALDHLTAILHDADALGLTREARDRVVAAIGAFDRAMITCASLECPVRSAYQVQPPTSIPTPSPQAWSAQSLKPKA